MESNKTKIALTSMLALSVFFGGMMVVKNKSARNEAAKEKTVLMTEKDMLTKEAKLLASEKQTFANLSSERKKKIDELLLNLDAKNSEIQKLSVENSNLKILRKKVSEFDQIKNELNNEIAVLRNNLNNAKTSRSGLEAEMNELILQNEKMSAELSFLRMVNTNDFLVKGVKRSKKITSFASRTKELSLSFDFPENYLSELSVTVQTPDGKSYLSTDQNLLTLQPTNQEAATTYPTGLKAKRMELSLRPEKKFTKGVYKFTVFKANEAIETILLQLK